jgi:hypothetical protein
MSGGSYNYIYTRLEDLANEIKNTETDYRRATLKQLLLRLSVAMHDVEWVDSCDFGPGDDHEALDALFGMFMADPIVVAKAAAYDSLRERLVEFFNMEGWGDDKQV